jgi:Glycine cleavage system T protein (aminomethyltransferase)
MDDHPAGRRSVLSADGAGAERQALDHLTFAAGDDVTIANVTDHYGMLVVAGPKARDVLAPLTSADLTNAAFRWLSAQEITIAGISVRALRITYVGELGWELHAPMGELAKLYDAIWASGQAHGITDFGALAVNSLRMEKAYRGYGAELTNEITLIEADCERFYAPGKGEFNGRAATENRRQQGITTKLVYGEVSATDCDIYGGEAVMQGDKVGRCLHLGWLWPCHRIEPCVCLCEPDKTDRLEVVILGERRTLRLLDKPAWDPINARQKRSVLKRHCQVCASQSRYLTWNGMVCFREMARTLLVLLEFACCIAKASGGFNFSKFAAPEYIPFEPLSIFLGFRHS